MVTASRLCMMRGRAWRGAVDAGRGLR